MQNIRQSTDLVLQKQQIPSGKLVQQLLYISRRNLVIGTGKNYDAVLSAAVYLNDCVPVAPLLYAYKGNVHTAGGHQFF